MSGREQSKKETRKQRVRLLAVSGPAQAKRKKQPIFPCVQVLGPARNDVAHYNTAVVKERERGGARKIRKRETHTQTSMYYLYTKKLKIKISSTRMCVKIIGSLYTSMLENYHTTIPPQQAENPGTRSQRVLFVLLGSRLRPPPVYRTGNSLASHLQPEREPGGRHGGRERGALVLLQQADELLQEQLLGATAIITIHFMWIRCTAQLSVCRERYGG